MQNFAQQIDSNIVIINLDHLDRNGIAKQLEIIKKYQPRVIALDAFFTKDSLDTDTLLLRQIRTTPNLVMTCSFFTNASGGQYIKTSNPKFAARATAHVNFLASQNRRQFAVNAFAPFIEYNNETYSALGLVLAKSINPAKAADFLNNHYENVEVPILFQYPGYKFPTLSAKQLLEENFLPQLLKNKIVLIGFIGPGAEDLHTVLLPDKKKSTTKMYGVEIHAHIINTILK